MILRARTPIEIVMDWLKCQLDVAIAALCDERTLVGSLKCKQEGWTVAFEPNAPLGYHQRQRGGIEVRRTWRWLRCELCLTQTKQPGH